MTHACRLTHFGYRPIVLWVYDHLKQGSVGDANKLWRIRQLPLTALPASILKPWRCCRIPNSAYTVPCVQKKDSPISKKTITVVPRFAAGICSGALAVSQKGHRAKCCVCTRVQSGLLFCACASGKPESNLFWYFWVCRGRLPAWTLNKLDVCRGITVLELVQHILKIRPSSLNSRKNWNGFLEGMDCWSLTQSPMFEEHLILNIFYYQMVFPDPSAFWGEGGSKAEIV